jgi:hypothetical protein
MCGEPVHLLLDGTQLNTPNIAGEYIVHDLCTCTSCYKQLSLSRYPHQVTCSQKHFFYDSSHLAHLPGDIKPTKETPYTPLFFPASPSDICLPSKRGSSERE